MEERERETVVVEESPPSRVERETTVISTDGGGGSGGTIAAILVLLILAVLAFLYFNGSLGGAADETNLNVNIDAPNVEVPDKIEVDLPEVTTNSN